MIVRPENSYNQKNITYKIMTLLYKNQPLPPSNFGAQGMISFVLVTSHIHLFIICAHMLRVKNNT